MPPGPGGSAPPGPGAAFVQTAFGEVFLSPADLGLPSCPPPAQTAGSVHPPGPIGPSQAWQVRLEPPAACEARLAGRLGRTAYGLVNGDLEVQVPWAACFSADSARRVWSIRPQPGVPWPVVQSYWGGLVLPLWLQTRELWMLHGSALDTPRGVLVLVGPQGAGKSTTAAALARLPAWSLFADDTVPLAPPTSGPVLVQPGLARSKLLPDAYERLAGPVAEAAHLWDGIDKYCAAAPHPAPVEPRPLIGLVELVPEPAAGPLPGPVLEPLTGLARWKLWQSHRHRLPDLAPASPWLSDPTPWARSAPCWRLTRPAGADTLEAVVQQLRALGESQP